MKNGFLEQVAQHIIQEHGNDLQQIAVFLPNQTGIHFFRKALAAAAKTTVWAPVCLTPGKQMEKASGLLLANKIKLASELHQVYQQVLGRTPEPFERFFPWADLLLNDFDDIDKYLANAKALYANLAGIKNINEQFSFLTEEQIALIRRFWKSYEEPSVTATKERFLRIWEKLGDVYETYTRLLPQKGFGYEGLLHRKAVEDKTNLFVGLQDVKAAYVIGFNRLNACEKSFFQELRKKYNTFFFYDVHPHTVEDKMHEAGKFYRETSFFFPQKIQLAEQEFHRSIATGPTIEIVSVSSSTAAVKYAATQMKKAIDQGQEAEDILVMMPDEKQLVPLLYSLPENMGAVNITGGLALSETPILSLVRLLYTLRRTAIDKPKGVYYRISDVMKVLQHAYINIGFEASNHEIIKRLKEERRVRPERNMLLKDPIHSYIFSLNRDYPLHVALTSLFQLLLETDQLPIFEKRIVQTACEACASVSEVIQSEGLPSDDKASFMLLNNVLRATRIPFEGEPVVGSQIMGPLETRNIDFKTVIIPAMTDDFFPGTASSKTYIPFALRRAFGLPLPEDITAEFSHIFFRLLQRAETITLLCNTSASSMSTGEPSRFILRLQADAYYEKLLTRKSVVEQVQFKEPLEISIPKDQEVWEKMLSLTDNPQKAVFPTAINTYLDCSLRFYFRYIAGIKEEDELSDVADYAAFGSIFHWIVEWMYQAFVEKEIQAEDIETLRGQFDALSEKAFKQHFGYKESESFDFEGETLIQREVIRKYVNRLLDLDSQYAPFEVVGLELGEWENKLQMPLTFDTEEGTKTVWLAGKIDRVDEKNGITRIIDYKTGSDELKYASVPHLFDTEINKRNKAALQTWLYGLIYGYNHPEKDIIQAGVISVRNMFEEHFEPILLEKIDPESARSGYKKVYNLYEQKDVFLEEMKKLFQEMYNKDIPFVQTEKIEKCATCPYVDICRR